MNKIKQSFCETGKFIDQASSHNQNETILLNLRKQFHKFLSKAMPSTKSCKSRRKISNTFWHEYGHVSAAISFDYTFTMLILFQKDHMEVFYPDFKKPSSSSVNHVCVGMPPCTKFNAHAISLYFDKNYQKNSSNSDFLKQFHAISFAGTHSDINRRSKAKDHHFSKECFKSYLSIVTGFGLLNVIFCKKGNDLSYYFCKDASVAKKFSKTEAALFKAFASKTIYDRCQYNCLVGNKPISYDLYEAIYKAIP